MTMISMTMISKGKIVDYKVIPAGTVDPEHILCPSCQGDDLILEGFLQRPYAVTSKAGEVLTSETPEGPWHHDVRVIRCQSQKCGETHSIISDEMWELMQAASIGIKPC